MKVLVVGSGGREHALAWKSALSPRVSNVYVAPGNAGTAAEPGVENVDIGVDDFEALADFAAKKDVALTIVGPEAPLVDGIVEFFAARGLGCFGPSSAAARLEGSKAFAKEFMQRHGIPTAASETFGDLPAARAYVKARRVPIVIKADGLAAGKGVIVASTEKEAFAALDAMLSGNAFGSAGERVVVEEFLEGEEASFICLCDGRTALPFASSQDHKAAHDGDNGPNTGGMGAYSPAPVVTGAVHRRIVQEIIEPTMAGMAADGAPYVGFLYAGLMIAPDGAPRVIEFNCRFGDPEAQPVLMRLRSDLPELCMAALAGGLEGRALNWDTRAALGVVMAAGGYPGSYARGAAITGLEKLAGDGDIKAFHAGTRVQGPGVVTSGGRVLCVVALGEDVTGAQQRAYRGVARIDWDGAFHRTDIGYRAVARERGE
ncbi:MAG: phosphoribosylamine--glycine ligase [Gammaproteobacteria bacterium]|nr:phosphoribosylamine--glycine ligase [Gammaproteobacteria bacterium]MDE0367212.1 phosphoribosylamine--glycine ligase [Gammaproteobacteria bacterium]